MEAKNKEASSVRICDQVRELPKQMANAYRLIPSHLGAPRIGHGGTPVPSRCQAVFLGSGPEAASGAAEWPIECPT